jgi:23S rRNA (adenine2030-N6)-methyltransferase
VTQGYHEGDGISEINRQLASLSEKEADATFLHADPYQPLEAGEDGATTLDLLGRAAALGAKCMLWYGFDSVRDRDDLRIALRFLSDASRDGGKEEHRPPWYGEVSLRADDLSEIGFDPGVLGCGVLLCNVGEEVLAACERLGEGLARIYAGARLPNGTDGSLAFEQGRL